jgi:phage gp29-like protein
MAESSIVDAHGRPIRKAELKKELAAPSLTGVRQVWHNGIASHLTPDRLGMILRAAENNDGHDYLTLAEEMEEREPHYASVLGTRKRAVSGLDVVVESASDEPADVRLADAVRDLVRDAVFGDLIEDLLDALGKGYSVAEIMWNTKGGQWWPREYVWRDPRFFRFDQATGRELRLIDPDNVAQGVPLAPYKFIVHRPRLKAGIPLRGGLARLVAVSYMAKSYTLTDWLAFAEVFGMPLRLGRYNDSAKSEEVDILRAAVANLGSDAAAILPEGMKIEFQEIANTQGGADLFKGLAEWIDKQTSKAVLGQTMTTDDGSSQAQATVHNDVREDIQRADARHLGVSLNRDLVKPFIDLNYGVQRRYPNVRIHVPEPEDLKQLVAALKDLVPLGLKVESSVISDKLGLPDPAKDADILMPEQQVLSTVQSASNQSLKTAQNRESVVNESEPDFDAIAEAEDDWEVQLAPLIDPIERLAQRVTEEGGNEEDFLARLGEVLDEMDETELVRRLASSTFKARGLGDARDD